MIPITEKLPKQGEIVLDQNNNKVYLNGVRWVLYDDGEVVITTEVSHWMPLLTNPDSK